MVKIKLPKPQNYDDVYSFLRQMELAVHHAQKSLEQLEGEGGVNPDDMYATFRFPEMDLYDRLEKAKERGEELEGSHVKVHVDEEADEMTEIEIEIGIA